MKRIFFLMSFFCGFLHSATSENFSIKLEQVPGTHDVIVVGSWDIDGVQGWSCGICFDPPDAVNVCPESNWHNCPAVELTDDFLTRRCGNPPDFHSILFFEDGITQGASLAMMYCYYEATNRFEFLKISFDLLAEEADLSFCDTLGDPAAHTLAVHGGNSYTFGTQEGLTLYNHKFIRGDANADGAIDIADAIVVFTYLFRDRHHVNCHAACDANDDGALDLSDVITILNYLFQYGDDLPEPFTQCGFDPTRSRPQLDCVSYEPCR